MCADLLRSAKQGNQLGAVHRLERSLIEVRCRPEADLPDSSARPAMINAVANIARHLSMDDVARMPLLLGFRRIAALMLVVLPVFPSSTLSAAEPASQIGAFTHPINDAKDAPLVDLGSNGLLRYALYAERGGDHARDRKSVV